MTIVASILFITCVSIILFFALAEAYLRLIGFKPYIRTCPGQYADKSDGVWEPHPYLGWTRRRASSEINLQGFRDTKDFDRIKNTGRQRIMILGDSFMYGTGVRYEESVPFLLEDRLQGQYEVFNLAMEAWGIDQIYLSYQTYRDIIHPHVVILAFIDDDVVRALESYRTQDVGMNKPSFEVIGGHLVLRSNCDLSWKKRIASKSIFLSLLNREISIAWYAREIATHIFNRMIEETQKRDEHFIIVHIPQVLIKGKTNWFMFQTRYALWKGMLMVRGLQWNFNSDNVLQWEALKEMQLEPGWPDEFYLSDGHLSVRGNAFIAQYLAKVIKAPGNL